MAVRTFQVPAIDCAHCVATIKREVGEIHGVVSVKGDETTKEVTVAYQPEELWTQISALLTEIGYAPQLS